MNHTRALLSAFLLALLLPAVPAADLLLVHDGQPRAEIVIAEKPQRSVRIAAADLQEYVRKISGARLPIVTEPSRRVVKLFVGQSAHTDRLGITAEGLKFGAYRMVSGADWMVLIGDDIEFTPIEPYAKTRQQLKTGKRTWTGLSFQVADVIGGAAEIVAAGGLLLREPQPEDGEPPHLAMCADTEGNKIMLTRKREGRE